MAFAALFSTCADFIYRGKDRTSWLAGLYLQNSDLAGRIPCASFEAGIALAEKTVSPGRNKNGGNGLFCIQHDFLDGYFADFEGVAVHDNFIDNCKGNQCNDKCRHIEMIIRYSFDILEYNGNHDF